VQPLDTTLSLTHGGPKSENSTIVNLTIYWLLIYAVDDQQRHIKASARPGVVSNAGPLQTYNQLTNHHIEIFYSCQLRAPKTVGLGAAAP